MGTLSEVCDDFNKLDGCNLFFNIKAGGDRMTNEENRNDLTEKFMSSEVV